MICNNEFDYNTLPGFEKLNEGQQRIIQAEYERGYMSARHLGVKLATGRGYETAKLALEQQFKPKDPKQQPTPPSIFEGLDNCKY
jgi:hypothetical protein